MGQGSSEMGEGSSEVGQGRSEVGEGSLLCCPTMAFSSACVN